MSPWPAFTERTVLFPNMGLYDRNSVSVLHGLWKATWLLSFLYLNYSPYLHNIFNTSWNWCLQAKIWMKTSVFSRELYRAFYHSLYLVRYLPWRSISIFSAENCAGHSSFVLYLERYLPWRSLSIFGRELYGAFKHSLYLERCLPWRSLGGW